MSIGLVSKGFLLGVGCLSLLTLTKPAKAAEEIRLIVGGPALILPFSVDSLETFAETGEVASDLRPFARFLDEETEGLIRQGLQRPIPLNVVQTSNITYSALGQDALENLGKVIRLHPDINGYRGLRGAIIGAAAQAGPEGWTLLDVLRQFPSDSIDIRLQDLLALRRALAVYDSYNQAAVAAIQAQAALEAETQPPLDTLSLVDLSLPGPHQYEEGTLTLTNPEVRQTDQGLQIAYEFTADTYLPQALSQPAPIIIISHGFGDTQESFVRIAEHLASHGFAVMVVNHVGSNLDARQNFFQGFLNTILSPSEFISRPQEVSFLIDELERQVATSPDWAAQLNVNQIGVLGDSLGGSTVLGLAGAEISFAHLEQNCHQERFIFNFALYLQCQARFLPPQNRSLRDQRIKAAIALHPLGAGLYGPDGMGQIDIPLLMVSGSQDIVSPTIEEQIHPFIWMQSEEKYLALLTQGTHFTGKPGRTGETTSAGIFKRLIGEHRDIGFRYFRGLSVAFWRTYLQEQGGYRPYLTARYGDWLSEDEPLQLNIIQSLTPEDLIESYGRQPPIPIVPTSVATTSAPRDGTVLEQIEQTGVLKVAFRQDAAPFGYIDSEANWTGYCREFANDLKDYLSQTMGQSVDIGLIELSSDLTNRFSLVQDDIVHLECGPNTIRQDIDGVTFSLPLLVTGTQFLVRRDQVDLSNPNPRLANARVAILPETTTENYIRETFPQAELVPFTGTTGRSEAVKALAAGEVDVFASDGVLSISEVARQNRTLADYALFPERPLTCEFYGLLLPANDSDWQNLVNDFITDTHDERLNRQVPSRILEDQLSTLDYCLNRQ